MLAARSRFGADQVNAMRSMNATPRHSLDRSQCRWSPEASIDHFAIFTVERLEIDNNAAERSLRGVALGRKNWLLAGSNKGDHRAASIYSLVETVRLNGVDPEAWLADTISRIADHPARRVAELMPWNYRPA